jgi:hypothetical protein
MRILCVATKPPWPPRDGGRLALALTLQGLAEAGHQIFVIAAAHDDTGDGAPPADGIVMRNVVLPRRHWATAALHALRERRALSVARHHHAELEQAVSAALASFRPHVVHAEQLQALANCSAARAAGVPVVLRAQNVESDIWRQTATARWRTLPLAYEARRLRAEETRAVKTAARTLTLTANDAAALRRLVPPSDAKRIDTLPPAFPQRLVPGPKLPGEPAIALSGSAGWWPNLQATQWFLRDVLPRLRRQIPQAVVHVFGGDAFASGPQLCWHPAPAESADAFPENAIAAVPLFVGSGIRMRILEAWARGLPVVATSIAARGLDVIDGRELSIADGAEEFCAAIGALAASPDRRAAHVDAGRAYLAQRHDPQRATQALLDIYRQAMHQRQNETDPL